MDGMKTFLIGLLLGLIALPVAAFAYLRLAHLPVAVADPPFPWEKQIVSVPLDARIEREMPKTTPIEASAANFEAGAQIYRRECAACHGLYGQPSSFGPSMFPQAPQLWKAHRNGIVGVSDDPPGETYWKVANGIRLTGMPAYNKVLNETQMWQVTLLLANAGGSLPAHVLEELKRPLDAPQAETSPAPIPR